MKEYIKPTINIQQVVVEQLLAGSGEDGNLRDPHSKRNDFWSDEDEASTADEWK